MTTTESLQISLAQLPHAVGSYREYHINWIVPAGWSTEVLTLPQGTEVPIDVKLTTVDDGVLVQVESHGELLGDCVRCLDPLTEPWTVDTADVYFEETAVSDLIVDGDVDMEGQPQDQPRVIVRDEIDLEPMLRDTILAAATLTPLCEPDCLGLCATCGEKLADLPADHAHEDIDPRLAVLRTLLEPADE
ncbi:DUF177 domain-containing protein [Actinomycetaceae bacterium WB03_NA08]|uniref:DUF177 domain-containing protein n=1 Tax=Scrofimicrobium canadense TaxID=2652290 RepID=A0A6N7W577_9ACTO|nr:DUF177 domain-containing protein [Scrofimicrobium canadense]MSS83663.1 DUF177 domain-containing protein [Scrofimicrobium canadense]